MGKILEFPIKSIVESTEEKLSEKEIYEIEEESYFGWTAEEYREWLNEVASEEWICDEKGLRVK